MRYDFVLFYGEQMADKAKQKFSDYIKQQVVCPDQLDSAIHDWLKVEDVMTTEVLTISPEKTLTDAAKIMAKKKISSIIVTDGDNVKGVLNVADLPGIIVDSTDELENLKITDCLNEIVAAVEPDTSALNASVIIENEGIKSLPVIKNDALVGVITQTDIVKAIKDSLHAEEKKYFEFLEGSKSSVFTTDQNGIITYVNTAFMLLLELKDKSQVIGKPFLPKNFWENLEDKISFLDELKKGFVESKELILKTNIGKVIHIAAFITRTRNIHGQINGTQGTLYDITAKKELNSMKEMQKSLAESEERFRSLLESTSDWIWEVDADYKFVYSSPNISDLLGLDNDQMIGKTFFDLIDQKAEDNSIEMLRSALQSNQNFKEIEVIFKDINGHQHIAQCFGSPILDDSGKFMGFRGINRDITNRKRAQITLDEAHEKLKNVNKTLEKQNAALSESRASALKLIKLSKEANAETENANIRLEASIKQANKMANESILANKSKSDFLANMSHEIRTPMNAIIGFSDILFEEKLSDEQKNYVNMIRESGQNLLQLINDILDFSKIEAGKLDTEIVDCSISDILSNIESMMKPAAKNKGIEFKVVYETKIPKTTKTDPTRLHQCLVNLINNAIKFTQKGHVYTFISAHKSQKKHWLRFKIEDTGIGIEKSMCKNIFESFSQADSGTTRKFGGTGLGLAITKSLAELLGGSINVSSRPGKGSVFTIDIPVMVNSDVSLDDDYGHTDKDKISENEIQGLSGKVLVAEDNKSNQKLIRLILSKMGICPVIVEDGQKAVEIHKNEKFDLIIMDIQMPKMNGYDATKAIRKTDTDIPVVAITANAMKGDAEKCFNAGCTEYLPKPIKRDELYEILEKYLKKVASPEQTKQNTMIDLSDETSSKEIPDNSDQTLIAISKFDDDPKMSDAIKIFLREIIDITEALEHAARIKDMPLLKALFEQFTIGSERTGFTAFAEKIKQTETNMATKPENIESEIQTLKKLACHIVDNQKIKSL